MSRPILNSFLVLFLMMLTHIAWGANASVGNMAENLLEPVTVVSDFVGTIAIVIGISFLFAAFVKYMQHRVSPLEVPLSTVIMLLVMGIILVCLPMAYKITESGIPYGQY